MNGFFDFSTPLKAILNASIYTSLLLELSTICAIISKVMPHFRRNKVYYVTVLIQAVVDFLQSATVAFCTIHYIHQIKYGGIWMFQVSVMLTAFLSVYWMNIMMKSKRINTVLLYVVTTLSVPMLSITGYNTIFKIQVQDITTVEWLLMSGARNFAQISYGCVTFITTLYVYRIKTSVISPTTRKMHRKVWIGLIYKTICSVGVALFGINTFYNVILYGSLWEYMTKNPWWEPIYFSTTCAYSGVNTCITTWMLSGLIFRRKIETTVVPSSRTP